MRTRIAALAAGLFALLLPAGAGGAEIVTWRTESRFVDPSKAASGYNHPGAPPRPNALRVNVYLPDGFDPQARRRYPVLFLLHGAGDAYDSWALPDQGEIMEVAQGFRGIIVMPEADRGFYTNWWNGGRRGDPGWERYHLDELIPLVEKRLPIRRGRRWHSIYGFSMGGMGAMFYASQRPGYFGSAGSSQGTLSLQRPEFQAKPVFETFIEQDPDEIFGDPQDQEFYWQGHNPTKLVANLAETRLYVAVGDGLPGPEESPGPGQLAEAEVRLQSEEFVAAVRERGIPVTYRPQRGTHAWPSRRRHLAYALREWGLFDPTASRRSIWTYRTVARVSRAWGFAFRFDRPPAQLQTFSRAGNRLTGEGAGRATIRTHSGCRFVVTLPFARRISRVCGGAGGRSGEDGRGDERGGPAVDREEPLPGGAGMGGAPDRGRQQTGTQRLTAPTGAGDRGRPDVGAAGRLPLTGGAVAGLAAVGLVLIVLGWAGRRP